jgi:hypothetical protein
MSENIDYTLRFLKERKTFERQKHRGGIGYLIAFLDETGLPKTAVSEALGLSNDWVSKRIMRNDIPKIHFARLHELGKYYQEHKELPTPAYLDTVAPYPKTFKDSQKHRKIAAINRPSMKKNGVRRISIYVPEKLLNDLLSKCNDDSISEATRIAIEHYLKPPTPPAPPAVPQLTRKLTWWERLGRVFR